MHSMFNRYFVHEQLILQHFVCLTTGSSVVFLHADFPVDGTLNAYLCAQRYIEELQKFLEEDNYKTSLMLEPPPPTAVMESYSRCVSPSVKEDPPRKTSGFLGNLTGDGNSRGLPALTASFHGLSFRSPSSGTNASSVNGALVSPKTHRAGLSTSTKAALINSSFESDQAPPPSKVHCAQHFRQQSASFSSPSNILTGKDPTRIVSPALAAISTEPLADTPDSLPTTPICRISKRPGKIITGNQLFPECYGSDGTVDPDFEKVFLCVCICASVYFAI